MSTHPKPNMQQAHLQTRLSLRRQIAEEILGPIQWEDAVTGRVRCPGADTHSSATTDDVRVKIDGAPTISCFHGSCSEAVNEANSSLRSQIAIAETGQEPLSITNIPGPDRKRILARRRAQLASLNGELQRALQNPTSPIDLLRRSPKPIAWREEEDWKHLIGLFSPRDTIWMGEITDSRPAYFKRVPEWLGWTRCPGSRICPSTFGYRCGARTKANVVSRRFVRGG